MQLFFLQNMGDKTFEFSEEESKHCIRVLRKKVGDELTLINGNGLEARAIITQDNPKKCCGNILETTLHPPQKRHIHLVVCPTKNTERTEWMLEKCVEIGIQRISFIYTENSERNKINLDRCLKIAISAIKQSKQFYLPTIDPIQSFQSFLAQEDSVRTEKLICWCPQNPADSLAKIIYQKQADNIRILIGPEGDFTAEEVSLAQQKDYLPCSLGSTILRSETAGLYALSLVNGILQLPA